jgi:hypothetical protein
MVLTEDSRMVKVCIFLDRDKWFKEKSVVDLISTYRNN